jgi:hypothetical protein
MDDASARNQALCRKKRHVRSDSVSVEVATQPDSPSGASSTTYPEWTWPNYPEGFQGSKIPVYGPYVAKLIEDRADGNLP